MLFRSITNTLTIPIIGIGAGAACDAQVLVWNDLMGLTERPPRFARKYRDLRNEMILGIKEWIADVEGGTFPSEKESFH